MIELQANKGELKISVEGDTFTIIAELSQSIVEIVKELKSPFKPTTLLTSMYTTCMDELNSPDESLKTTTKQRFTL